MPARNSILRLSAHWTGLCLCPGVWGEAIGACASFYRTPSGGIGRASKHGRPNALREVVRHAKASVPGYSLLYADAGVGPEDIRRPEDVRLLPTVDKALLRDNLKDFTATDIPHRHMHYLSTSGSTGIPFGFYQLESSVWIERAFIHLGWERAGWRPGDRSARLRCERTASHGDLLEGRRAEPRASPLGLSSRLGELRRIRPPNGGIPSGRAAGLSLHGDLAGRPDLGRRGCGTDGAACHPPGIGGHLGVAAAEDPARLSGHADLWLLRPHGACGSCAVVRAQPGLPCVALLRTG